jgi:hypothetical protein
MATLEKSALDLLTRAIEDGFPLWFYLLNDQNARTRPPANAAGQLNEAIELATEISMQGRTYKQIKRYGQVALYELSVKGELRGFEVIVIQIHAAGERFGKWYPTREGYASNESWGTSGFSYLASDKDGAERRFCGAERSHKWPRRCDTYEI